MRSLIDEVMSKHKRLTLSDSENKPLQSFDVDRVDDTGNLVEISRAGYSRLR